MEQYISKNALVAKIEKLKAYLQIPNAQLEAIQVCDNVISVINTLEVKEVDLEKELDFNAEVSKFIDTFYKNAKIGHKLMIKRTARHFFELGLKVKKGE